MEERYIIPVSFSWRIRRLAAEADRAAYGRADAVLRQLKLTEIKDYT